MLTERIRRDFALYASRAAQNDNRNGCKLALDVLERTVALIEDQRRHADVWSAIGGLHLVLKRCGLHAP